MAAQQDVHKKKSDYFGFSNWETCMVFCKCFVDAEARSYLRCLKHKFSTDKNAIKILTLQLPKIIKGISECKSQKDFIKKINFKHVNYNELYKKMYLH
ncbi:MAG: hypothetical protein PHX21_13005 [bacterium]|nr:hypothetical protein [bacterium]